MELMLKIFLVRTCDCQIASKLSLVNKSSYLLVWAFFMLSVDDTKGGQK